MRVLNILSSGGIGGIQVLCKYISMYADYDNTFCFLFGEGPVYDEMKKMGATVVSMGSGGKRKKRIGKIYSLLKLVDQHDVIVTHHASISTQFIFAALRILKPQIKYVMTAHSCFDRETYYIYGGLKNRVYALLLRQNLRKSDCDIFVSEAGKKSYVQEFRIDEEKAKVVYNGVPISRQLPAVEKHIHKPVNILYIGRLVKTKGVQLLIEAICRLRMEGIEPELTIVGDGEYRSALEKKANESHISDFVHFEGQQTDIGLYLTRSDIFVYPSVCQEVFGISIVEAMSYGIPCVGNQVGGIPEIIKNGYNGFLTEKADGDSLAVAIKDVLKMYQDLPQDEIATHCFETAKRFDIKNTVVTLKQIYSNLID